MAVRTEEGLVTQSIFRNFGQEMGVGFWKGTGEKTQKNDLVSRRNKNHCMGKDFEDETATFQAGPLLQGPAKEPAGPAEAKIVFGVAVFTCG